MRDLSLHLLDVIENSLRAGARTVEVSVLARPVADLLVLRVDDDGAGLPVAPERVLDPFFTTKAGKRTGLGLSLLRTSAEQAGGALAIGPRPGDCPGTRVEATMSLGHVDRLPLGDLGATLATVACTHPDVELRVVLAIDDREHRISTRNYAARDPNGGAATDPVAVAIALARGVTEATRSLALDRAGELPAASLFQHQPTRVSPPSGSGERVNRRCV